MKICDAVAEGIDVQQWDAARGAADRDRESAGLGWDIMAAQAWQRGQVFRCVGQSLALLQFAGGLIKCCQFCRSEALFVAGQFSRLGLLSAEGDAAVRNELQGKAVRVAEQVLNQQFIEPVGLGAQFLGDFVQSVGAVEEKQWVSAQAPGVKGVLHQVQRVVLVDFALFQLVLSEGGVDLLLGEALAGDIGEAIVN